MHMPSVKVPCERNYLDDEAPQVGLNRVTWGRREDGRLETHRKYMWKTKSREGIPKKRKFVNILQNCEREGRKE